ncbi:helix-turn-helix transcriptional regulator [Nocardiopsis sp. NPDC049922]|uniref:helix-turn-helix domain-containing protein n=1 Tax=Nocardiopsis sp. NPDC049922 TaxID=3155157 RepID=UPI00340E79B9
MKQHQSQTTPPTRRRSKRRFDRDGFRELLENKGYSLVAFAKATGISYSGLRKIAVGTRQPSPNTYRLILARLDLLEGSLRVEDHSEHREAA